MCLISVCWQGGLSVTGEFCNKMVFQQQMHLELIRGLLSCDWRSRGRQLGVWSDIRDSVAAVWTSLYRDSETIRPAQHCSNLVERLLDIIVSQCHALYPRCSSKKVILAIFLQNSTFLNSQEEIVYFKSKQSSAITYLYIISMRISLKHVQVFCKIIFSINKLNKKALWHFIF